MIRTSSVLLALAACAPPPSDDFVDELVTSGACGDVYFWAADEKDEVLLEVTADGLVSEAGEGTSTTTFTLPVDTVVITVTTGRDVSMLACSDVVIGDGPQFDETWTAYEGTAVITIESTGTDAWDGTLELRDIRLDGGDGRLLEIPKFSIGPEPVGWLPG